jgi:hypothetical protein
MEFNADHETVLDGFSNRIRRVLLTSAFTLVPIIITYLFILGVSSPNRSVAVAAAQAEPVCYPAIADTYVDSSVPDSNFGGNQTLDLGMFLGTTNQMYLQFDISKIPPDATIISGNVQAYMHYLETSENQFQTALHAPEGSWEELNLSWNNQPGLSSSYGASVLDTSTGWKVWDATNLVAQWHAGVLPNAGVVIVPDPFDPLAYNQSPFASREDPQGLIPQLCVVFEEPPLPRPTRTPLPTRTPIPTQLPTPGPAPTATPPVFSAPYFPIAEISIGTLLQPDLSIHGIEITQGIQCFDTSQGLAACADNSMPVVTKKDSTARIYLKYNGLFSEASNIPVRLFIRANGVWYTANALGKATKTIDQSKYDDARVYLNVNFTNDIPVDFYAIVDPNGTISETNESNNRFPASGYITLNFRRRDNLNIVGDRLRYHPSGYSGDQYAGGWAVNGGAADVLEQMLPIRNNGVNYALKSGYLNWTTSLSTGDGQHALIQNMNFRWILDNALSWLFGTGAFTGADHVYGWAPNDGYSGGHADMPVYPHAGGYGVVGIGSDQPGTSTDNPGKGALIFGHELVHDYNIYHTDTGGDDCGSNDGSSDFPYSTSSIQEFGFNPTTNKIYDPADTHDLMSYCPSGGSKLGWISPFTWNKMFNSLSPSLVAAQSAQDNTGVMQTTANNKSLVVNATIYNPDLGPSVPGELGDLYKIAAGISYPLPAGDYSVQLRSEEIILHTQTFTVSFEGEYDPYGGVLDQHVEDEPPFPPGPTKQADVSFIMPWVDGTNKILLLHGSQVLDQVLVSANPPIVNITSPVSTVSWPAGTTQTLDWIASDLDGDALSYSVSFSSDGGSSWVLLVAGLTDTSLDLEVDALAGSTDARFRVVATDGVNTAFDETPMPIGIPNKAPLVVITEPSDNGVFLPGALVVLKGSATDLEDGSLPDEALHWISDRQGSLGIGPSLPLTTLESGWHEITLSVIDSLGIPSSESRMVFIGYRIHLPFTVR